MSIGTVSGAAVNRYAGTNSSKKTGSAGNFAEEVQAAKESRVTAEKTASSVWAGDMVVPQPPNYFGFTYDSRISNKSKEEMTMDEYKQWFMNEMSGIPVSGWVRSTCVGGALTITEECFERMKKDPEWEKEVLGMLGKMYSTTGLMGSKMIGYQVVGATKEQCHGATIPVKDRSSLFADTGESWWERRHKRMEELLEEQEKATVKRAQVRSAAMRSEGVSVLAATAYEEMVSTFSSSGNWR